MEWKGHYGSLWHLWVPHRGCLDGARSNHPACQHQVGMQRGGARAERAGGGALRPAVAGEPAQPGVQRGCQTDSVRIKLPQDTSLPLPLQEATRKPGHVVCSQVCPKLGGESVPPPLTITAVTWFFRHNVVDISSCQPQAQDPCG